MWYLINSWKLFSENPQPHPHPMKKTTPLFYSFPLKIQKVQVPPFCQHWKFFRPPCRKWVRGGGEEGEGGGGHYVDRVKSLQLRIIKLVLLTIHLKSMNQSYLGKRLDSYNNFIQPIWKNSEPSPTFKMALFTKISV